jgi:hypothetical protein
VTDWDYGRISSLLQCAIDEAGGVIVTLESSTAKKFDLSSVLQRVEQVDRDVSAAKALLKRERLKRA